MKIKLNIRDIKPMLDRSAAQLDKETVGKLQAARRVALQHQLTSQRVPVLAWLGQHSMVHPHSSHGNKSLGWGVAALLVLVLFSGAIYWQHSNSNEYDHSDIDIAILTDDLPVNMYVD